MLKSCSRCGKVHEYNKCPLGEPKRTYYKKRNRVGERSDISRFRSSALWQRKREEIIKRDSGLCRLCLHNGTLTRANLEVHHIISIVRNDSLKLDNNNLITLCNKCHNKVETNESYVDTLLFLARIPPYKSI